MTTTTEAKFVKALIAAIESGLSPIDAAAEVAAEANAKAAAQGWDTEARAAMLTWWADKVADMFGSVLDQIAA